MKKVKKHSIMRKSIALFLALQLCLSSFPVQAEDSVSELELETSELKKELSSLNQELSSLSAEITDLAKQIDKTNADVAQTKLDLAAARLDSELQYNSMKKRIKYIYEHGSYSLLQILITSDDMTEFINKSEFVSLMSSYDRKMFDDLKQAEETIKKREKQLEEQQKKLDQMKADMDRKKAQLDQKIDSTEGKLDASSKALAEAKAAQEAARKALEEQKRQEAAQKPPSNAGSTQQQPISSTTDDLVLFAAILECEAGSSNYNALLAVATIIMNRVQSPDYPNTIKGVVYQKGQFSPTWNGSLNRVLRRGPRSLCYQAAQDALNGARLSAVAHCYQFRSASTGRPGIEIGGNVFF